MADEDLRDDMPGEDAKLLEPVDITIDDGTPEAAKDSKAAAQTIIPAQEGLDQIRADLQRERDARAREQRGRLDAEQRAQVATSQVGDSQFSQIEHALAATQAKISGLERDLQAAAEAGDWGKLAKTQSALGVETARQVQLEGGKYQIEQERANRRAAPVQQQQPQPQLDPVEAFARSSSPKSAAWIRAHPESVADQARQQRLIDAHRAAVQFENLTPDTDEYFASIESKMGYRQAAQAQQRQAPVQQRAAAPVSRDIPSTNGTVRTGRTIHLTAEERDQARREGMTDKEWATAKAELMERNPSYGRTH